MSNMFKQIMDLDARYAVVSGIAALSIDNQVFPTVEDCYQAIPNATPQEVYAIIDKATGTAVESEFRWFKSGKQVLAYYVSLLQPKMFSYAVKINPDARGESDMFHVQEYSRTSDGDLVPSQVLYVGNYEKCFGFVGELTSEDIHSCDFVHISVASACPCYMENAERRLEPMVALVSDNNKVYLGKSSQYDSRGHYFNADSSLIFISDNYDALDVVTDGIALVSQVRLQETGCFTQQELENIRQMELYIKL